MLTTCDMFIDDGLSDDAMESYHSGPVALPPAEIGNLPDIEQIIRVASTTQQSRESLAKFVITEDYIRKLLPMLEIAEDLGDLPDLHHLSSIMKMLILLNDNQIIEQMVSDWAILAVVGALECRYIPCLKTTGTNKYR